MCHWLGQKKNLHWEFTARSSSIDESGPEFTVENHFDGVFGVSKLGTFPSAATVSGDDESQKMSSKDQSGIGSCLQKRAVWSLKMFFWSRRQNKLGIPVKNWRASGTSTESDRKESLRCPLKAGWVTGLDHDHSQQGNTPDMFFQLKSKRSAVKWFASISEAKWMICPSNLPYKWCFFPSLSCIHMATSQRLW